MTIILSICLIILAKITKWFPEHFKPAMIMFMIYCNDCLRKQQKKFNHTTESLFLNCEQFCIVLEDVNLELLVFAFVAHMGEERGVYRVLLGKPEGKRPLGRPRYRWVDNIRTDLQEVECGYMDWIGLVQDRERWRTLVSAVMNLGVP